jgi:hypothetical protein
VSTEAEKLEPESIDAIAPRAVPRRVRRKRDVQISRWLLFLIPFLTLVLVFGVRFAVTSRSSKIKIAVRLAKELANRTDAAVRLGGLTFGWAYQPCVQQIEIYRASKDLEISAQTHEACVDRWTSAVGSGFRAMQIRLDSPKIRIEGLAKEKEDAGLAAVQPTAATSTKARARAAKQAPLREFSLVFDDLRVDWLNLPIPQRLATGSLGPIDGAVTVQKRGAQSAASITLREPITGLVMTARANPTTDGWDFSARIEGDLAPSLGKVLTVTGFDVKRLPVRGDIGAVYSTAKRTMSVDLDMFLQDADIASRLVSARRLVDLKARTKLHVDLDLNKKRLSIKDGVIEVNGIPSLLSLDVGVADPETLPKVVPAPSGLAALEFNVSVALKTTPMLKLLDAIPGAEPIEELKSLSPRVLFALSFTMNGLLKDPETWKPVLEHRVIGIGEKGAGSGLEYLFASSWDYYPLLKEGRAKEARKMGPASPTWTPYSKVPYPLRSAIQISEDASFFVHHGVDIEEIRQAIIQGVTSGEKTRGGSTLTQQLIKNLYLTRDRTAMRKVQEALVTLLMESALSKDQIFELYMNLIEWGPNIYGVQEAAQHYFGKSPERLSIKEATYIASIIPGPILYHQHYETGSVPQKFSNKIERTIERMAHLGRISEADAQAAIAAPIVFKKPRAPK